VHLDNAALADLEPRGRLGDRFDGARLLVRNGGEPLGFIQVSLPDGRLSAEATRRALAEQIGPSVDLEMPVRSSPIASSWPEYAEQEITVAVSTRDRPEQLHRCLRSVMASRHNRLELLVVDSASRNDSTERVVKELASGDTRIRYLREHRPGLSAARNRAVREAVTPFIAFVDDDATVDPLWVSAILRGFRRRSDVACVTGMLASMSLERPAEQHYDRRLAWSSLCQPCLYTLEGPGDRDLYPYAPGAIGGGSNLAFATRTLLSLGGFDESLGVGTATGGAEDLDIFVRTLRAGHAISYEPAALVWHEHRQTMHDVCRQAYTYGKALSAYVTKYLLAPESRHEILIRGLAGLRRAAALSARSGAGIEGGGPSWPLVAAELVGFVAGPAAYLISRSRLPVGDRRAVAP
jgi:glycosyltransferase involved in cell wall biosynthesis